MAKIKTTKYLIDGAEIEVNFNCSSKGVFSASIPYVISETLGIEHSKLTGPKLDEIEKIISNAYMKYIDSNTNYKLKIGIAFGACGEFVKDPDGNRIEELLGYGNEFLLSSFGNNMDSMIGFDFRVIIEENRDGRFSYFEAKKIPEDFSLDLKWKKVCGKYMDDSRIHRFDKNEKIIEFSETAMQNLEEIQKQMRKASTFLIKLITSEKLDLMLNSADVKLLTNS
ncbi:hypothetical protein U9K52_09805 [Chryseobacterium sp. MHB01]|uniref:hypothetical protein n=1 Tax=Chryseobacterium sp. MHB01 TaxID=3109433 RepID=UPI002AFDCBE6|nr:hypothetical protein [Chryseobacterium sp. MHB01]MEA1849206.1 hypothetical protein [Chryseobacterium sp. MHB01]